MDRSESVLEDVDGFSLLEVLFAVSIVSAALAGVAQLSEIAIRAARQARLVTDASILAGQKMEQLRGTDLPDSPAHVLDANVVGFADYVPSNGEPLDAVSPVPPVGTAFVRRWSIEPLPSDPDNTRVLQVLVSRWPERARAEQDPGFGGRLPGDVRIVSVKTRTGH